MSIPSASELRDALAAFMAASSTRDGTKIAAALTRVCDLEQRLGPDAPPMLRHYLERRSYQKALDFLNSGRPETETPQCGSH
jgi:hypothetical protein